MTSPVDALHMREAIALAAQASRAVRPNPRVGCVIVRDGDVVGRGFHAYAGGPHAEAVALQDAGERARGATAYVTLEPCNHWGRTPPCAQALIQAGVSRVVVAVRDPHELAKGGADALRAAGIAVDVGVLHTEAADLADVFLTNLREGRPLVQHKVAATADGFVHAVDRRPAWLTGEAARRLVHGWRAEADAVLIGSGTALADNPLLDCRALGLPAGHLPLRIVLDRRLQLPLDGHLAQTQHQPTLVITDDPVREVSDHADRLRGQGVEVLCVLRSTTWLADVLRELYKRGIHHVLSESGPTLATALWQARLVDRLDLLLAPRLLGDGTPWLGSLGLAHLEEAVSLRWSAVQTIGEDVWLTARPRQGGQDVHGIG